MAGVVFTPYTTAVPFFGAKPSWISNDLDIQRIQSYQTYEEIYWTVQDTFKVQIRGSNDLAIYVPTARIIVDTTNRYTAPEFAVTFVDRTTGMADTTDAQAAALAFTDLFARERFFSKFNGAKRYGLIRGDWVWHVTADLSKPAGTRISITAVDPAMYFPITADDDVDQIIGCHLAVQIVTPSGPQVHRLTYRKVLDGNGNPTGAITVEEGLFELNKWEVPDARPAKVIQQPTTLPAEITSLPVYHVRNFEEPGNPFGSSELRGFEMLMRGVNQTISDEDLALALEGIGMYSTDAPQPTDESGKAVPWQLGPGRVVQRPEGTSFDRVNGVSDLKPYGDHYGRLMDALKQSASVPDVAVGAVSVEIAQSGIALALQLQPLVAKAGEKNTVITEVHTQMMYDLLNGWMPAFEQTSFNNVRPVCTVGSAVPIDRAERVSELNDMLDRKVISTAYYRSEMTKLGYVFPQDIQAQVDSEAQKAAANTATAFGTDRINAELGGNPPTG